MANVSSRNNDSIVQMGLEGANRIREVITIQNETCRNSLEIQGDVKMLMERFSLTQDEVGEKLRKGMEMIMKKTDMTTMKELIGNNFDKMETSIKDLKIIIKEENFQTRN
jgi:hypothetical protein